MKKHRCSKCGVEIADPDRLYSLNEKLVCWDCLHSACWKQAIKIMRNEKLGLTLEA